MLRAWADLVSSNERVWGWYTFFAPDPTEAGRALQQYRTSVKGALDLASNASVGTTDEIEPLRSIYLSALFLVAAIDQDKATAASYQTVVSGLTSREQQERAKSTGHLESICRDERERLAGDAAATSGDLGSAQRHYAAAIAANPGNLAALLGVASVLFHQGDRAGAVAQARTATQYAGNDPAAWADLGRYSVATGDDSGARTAYEGFGSRLATQSPERQMASIRAALSDLSALVTADPVLAPHVQTILSVFDGFLSPLPDAEKDSFQYPALYAQLGRLALDVGSLKDGEAWLRRALDLDPHQPAAWADLVVAVIAEGRDATAVASGASAEIRDPLWAETADFHRPQLVALVSQEVSALEPRFPEQKEQLEAFKATIAAQAGT